MPHKEVLNMLLNRKFGPMIAPNIIQFVNIPCINCYCDNNVMNVTEYNNEVALSCNDCGVFIDSEKNIYYPYHEYFDSKYINFKNEKKIVDIFIIPNGLAANNDIPEYLEIYDGIQSNRHFGELIYTLNIMPLNLTQLTTLYKEHKFERVVSEEHDNHTNFVFGARKYVCYIKYDDIIDYIENTFKNVKDLNFKCPIGPCLGTLIKKRNNNIECSICESILKDNEFLIPVQKTNRHFTLVVKAGSNFIFENGKIYVSFELNN